MRRGPLFVLLGLTAAVPAAASCTHTVEGTGAAGAATSPTGTATTTASGNCVSIAGVWDAKGLAAACGSDSCDITQNGCDVVLDCIAGSFDGTVNGSNVQWEGTNGGTCSGTVGPAGARIDATCTGPAGSCGFVVTKN